MGETKKYYKVVENNTKQVECIFLLILEECLSERTGIFEKERNKKSI